MNDSHERKSISKKKRFKIFKRDSFTCQYCGRTAPNVELEVDHIEPVSKGGDNHKSNLVTSCFDCNRGKFDKELPDNLKSKVSKEGAFLANYIKVDNKGNILLREDFQDTDLYKENFERFYDLIDNIFDHPSKYKEIYDQPTGNERVKLGVGKDGSL